MRRPARWRTRSSWALKGVVTLVVGARLPCPRPDPRNPCALSAGGCRCTACAQLRERAGRPRRRPDPASNREWLARRNGASDGCNARRLGGRCAPPSRRGPTSLRSSGPSAAAPRATEARPQGAFCEELLPEIRQLVGEPVFTGEGYRKIWARLRHKGVRTAKDRVLQLL